MRWQPGTPGATGHDIPSSLLREAHAERWDKAASSGGDPLIGDRWLFTPTSVMTLVHEGWAAPA
jgi:hypothetical protein